MANDLRKGFDYIVSARQMYGFLRIFFVIGDSLCLLGLYLLFSLTQPIKIQNHKFIEL